MTIQIDNNSYDITFGFRVCRALRSIIGKVDLEGEEIVDLVFDKGPKLVHTAIKENKLKPIPSIDKIEDYFDEHPGFGTDFLIEALNEIGLHVTPTRVEEIEGAAKGN